jgi:hypothetical protein
VISDPPGDAHVGTATLAHALPLRGSSRSPHVGREPMWQHGSSTIAAPSQHGGRPVAPIGTSPRPEQCRCRPGTIAVSEKTVFLISTSAIRTQR